MSGPAGPRCASWAREAALSPAGTAPPTDTFVVVEHPLPWPGDVLADPYLSQLADVAAEAAGPDRRVRLQAVTTSAGAGTRRVIVFAAGPPPFVGYRRAEAVGTPKALPELVSDLVRADPPPPAPPGRVTDVLVCTHGSRDTCCGSLGTRLWGEIERRLPDVRVWRTSHTGGHRFAPTMITFPDGCYWAHLDAEQVEGIVFRSLPAHQAASHLRGCAAFAPPVQVADGAALAEHGWDWLGAARFGEERHRHRIELCFQASDGQSGCYVACLDEGRKMPIPDCGADPAAAAKFQTELRVARLQEWV